MLTSKRWAELKNGYGLCEVPHELICSNNLGCCMCEDGPVKGKLYSDQAVTLRVMRAACTLPNSSKDYVVQYQKMVDRLRKNCYCRFHAEFTFTE